MRDKPTIFMRQNKYYLVFLLLLNVQIMTRTVFLMIINKPEWTRRSESDDMFCNFIVQNKIYT